MPLQADVGAGGPATTAGRASSMTGVIVTAEFLPLGAPVVLPAGPTTPLLLNFTVSCRFARIEVTPPAAGCTLDILILAAS